MQRQVQGDCRESARVSDATSFTKHRPSGGALNVRPILLCAVEEHTLCVRRHTKGALTVCDAADGEDGPARGRFKPRVLGTRPMCGRVQICAQQPGEKKLGYHARVVPGIIPYRICCHPVSLPRARALSLSHPFLFSPHNFWGTFHVQRR